jgi:hypothetical protein
MSFLLFVDFDFGDFLKYSSLTFAAQVCRREKRMNRKWLSMGLRVLPAVLAALAIPHPALAHYPTVDAPEFDLRLAMEGLAVAGVAAGVIWERIRRRR